MKKDITLKEIREIQLDILDKIHAICIQNDFRYSLGGGTLLGAIRHKGYIPWDDDVDIMLPRPDYAKFLSIFEGKFEYIKLQHYGNCRSCLKPFAKAYDDRTILVEKYQKCGIYVDIFPIDGLPDESQLPSFIEEYKNVLRKLFRSTSTFSLNRNLWVGVKELVKAVVDPPREQIVKEIDDFFAQYPFDEAEYAGAIVGRYVEKEHMTSDVFKSYIDVPFEGRCYKAIAAFDAYLTKHYGNYMELPPEDKRVSNHEYKAFWK